MRIRKTIFLAIALEFLAVVASGQSQKPTAAPVLKAQGPVSEIIDDAPTARVSTFKPIAPLLSCTPLLAENQIAITQCGGNFPLLSVVDGTPLAATAYLTTIQAVNGVEGNTPLQILNQANSSGGALFPTPITGGYGGIDLIQSAIATKVSGVVTNYNSPFLQLCAQEMVGSGPTSGPDCWLAQVFASNVANPPDVFEWSRPTTNSLSQDITMLFPPSINLSAAGQMTFGPQPTQSANANVPSTLTGRKTSDSSSSATAGPVTVEPGQLTTTSAVITGMAEGALQILQSYIVGTNTNEGRLACPSGTAQSATVCTSFGAAENWVGVFNPIPGTTSGSITVTPLRYGRVGVSSFASGLVFNNGDFVCKDDVDKDAITGLTGYVVDNGGTPCPVGESVGVGVGDPSTPLLHNEHLVDLIPEAGVPVTRYWTNGPISGSVAITAANTQYIYGLIMPTPVAAGNIVLDVAMQDSTATDFYSVGIFNSAGSLIAHISPQSFTTTGVQSPIAFVEGVVTFSPGKYYLVLTGEATVLQLSSISSTLIPLPVTAEGPTTSGKQNTLISLPPPDNWVVMTNSEPAIALAP